MVTLAGHREESFARGKKLVRSKAARKGRVKLLPKPQPHPVSKTPPKRSLIHPVSQPKGKASLAHPVSPAGTKPQAHSARPGKVSVSKSRGAGPAGFNLVAVNNSKARSAPSYNGGYSTAYKAPDGAIRGTPSTSKMVRTASKALPLASSTPPMPRGKVTKSSGGSLPLGARIGAALAANKGNIQSLAKSRMIAAGKRG
jgi:hypothetical protein